MVIINLICLAIIICFIVDLSGFTDSWRKCLWKYIFSNKIKYREFELKPFTCSLCMTWWIGLIYLLIFGLLTPINIVILALLAYNADIISMYINLGKELLGKLYNKILETVGI